MCAMPEMRLVDMTNIITPSSNYIIVLAISTYRHGLSQLSAHLKGTPDVFQV